jgi:DNA-binding beta-propeller fold protein YncE
LRRLKQEFPDELVVVGVHSAKFPSEKLTDNIRQAVMRYEIHHPVVNDAGFRIWSEYNVRAWPTVVLIDPEGKIYGEQSGEISAEDLSPLIRQLIAEHEAQGLLDRRHLDARPEAGREPARLLQFPTRLVIAPGDLLYVADTGHHRVLEIKLTEDGQRGQIQRAFGSGNPDFQDGPAGTAAFHHPHGLTLSGDTLYVADTDNHAVRAIHLEDGQVRTVAGTGQMARGRTDGGDPLRVSLRSPWALCTLDQFEALFIAMAGSHQIWLLLKESELGPFAGNGREALVDGSLAEASFNQPSDLAFGLGHLFVADPEASAIRAISLGEQPQVLTLAGQGLFEFGDVDGSGPEVRLQHPTGIAFANEKVYIADSYNHKIKVLDPFSGEVQKLIGNGQPTATDGAFDQAGLFQPEGLAIHGDWLYIADTNNHMIRIANLQSRQLATLRLAGFEQIASPPSQLSPVQTTGSVHVQPGPFSLFLDIKPPDGYKINDEAPLSISWRLDGKQEVATFHAGDPVQLELRVSANASLILEVTVYYCQKEDERLCLIHDGQLEIPLEVSPGAADSISIPYSIQDPGS